MSDLGQLALALAPYAPALGGAASWLNVDHPRDLAERKGRVVVVDFWTSCCISCIHILAASKKIEARFSGQPVVVIGIHCPKFDAAPAQRPRHHHARRERVVAEAALPAAK